MKDDSIKFTLSKKERLHKKIDIEHLFSKGKKNTSFPLTIIHVNSLEEQDSKVIFLASKRIFQKAHQRNKVKRILREVYRLNKNLVPPNTFIGLSIVNKEFTFTEIESRFKKVIKGIS